MTIKIEPVKSGIVIKIFRFNENPGCIKKIRKNAASNPSIGARDQVLNIGHKNNIIEKISKSRFIRLLLLKKTNDPHSADTPKLLESQIGLTLSLGENRKYAGT